MLKSGLQIIGISIYVTWPDIQYIVYVYTRERKRGEILRARGLLDGARAR